MSMGGMITEYSVRHPDARYYVNLTNGLEAMPILHGLGIEPDYVNIQSTHLEQKNYDLVLSKLPVGFLMNLAVGRDVLVVDYGANKPYSRAVYQGVPFVRFYLDYRWYGTIPDKVIIHPRSDRRMMNVRDDFIQFSRTISRSTRRYLNKFRYFLNDDSVHLTGVSAMTHHDGDTAFYHDMVARYC